MATGIETRLCPATAPEFFTRVYGRTPKDVSKFYSIVEKCFLGSARRPAGTTVPSTTGALSRRLASWMSAARPRPRRCQGLTGKRAKMLQALRDTFDRQTAALEDLKAVTVGKTDTRPSCPLTSSLRR